MAWSVKCLPCQQEDLSSVLRDHVETICSRCANHQLGDLYYWLYIYRLSFHVQGTKGDWEVAWWVKHSPCLCKYLQNLWKLQNPRKPDMVAHERTIPALLGWDGDPGTGESPEARRPLGLMSCLQRETPSQTKWKASITTLWHARTCFHTWVYTHLTHFSCMDTHHTHKNLSEKD